MSDALLTPLRTHNLSVGFTIGKNSLVLFEHINLEINPGELICFMGPNGIGKTSLIRTLAGIQKPLGGTIVLHNSQPPALVLTDKIAATHMTVYDLISYGRYPYLNWSLNQTTSDRKKISDAIKQVHLEHLVDQKLNELSDGQLQMVLIAKALAQDTPLLLLDEPTAHLDLNNRVEVMNLLRRLARQHNKAILVATHELDLALQTADRIWLATQQKKIETGIPEDLVLKGTFDEVFQFKGFDLKTGKVYHEPHRGIRLQLQGDGHEYLWTKNALERNGFEIGDDADRVITIEKTETDLNWIFQSENNMITFNSLEKLLTHLSPL